jgi:hypothetical protein
MFVVDRTGSMCQFHDGRNDAACTDLANARAGMRTFLTLMDPEQDHVGLAVLPPAPDVAGRCESPGSYDDDLAYVVVPLSSDYLTGGALDEQSDLVSTIRCVKGGGSTSYAAALALAQRELEQHGRPEVQKVIVFLSDGAANTTPDWYPRDLQLADAPCHQGIAIASWIKARGTLVYSIGYDVNPRDDGHERCLDPSSGADEKPTITAYEALREIASDGDFYLGNDLTASQMRRIFSNVAADMLRGSSKLVADED